MRKTLYALILALIPTFTYAASPHWFDGMWNVYPSGSKQLLAAVSIHENLVQPGNNNLANVIAVVLDDEGNWNYMQGTRSSNKVRLVTVASDNVTLDVLVTFQDSLHATGYVYGCKAGGGFYCLVYPGDYLDMVRYF